MKVQSMIQFGKELNEITHDNKNDIEEVNDKLDIIIEKLKICSNDKDESPSLLPPEANEVVNIIKSAKNILELHGSGITFFPGETEGLVRCDDCFMVHCQNDPSLSGKDPFFVHHKNSSSCAGNSLALGTFIESSRKQELIEGHNQSWYRFKKMLVDHISCSNKRNGGDKHYQAIIERKKRTVREKALTRVVSNQLKCALSVVKMKSAALHYEHMLSLLHSCGSEIGNIGHGRKQLNGMITAFQAYLYTKINKVLRTPLPSTTIPPHFCTTSDKSTPLRTTNHAVMVLVM